jgi:primosomal protein N' (replication factor Y)
VSQFVDVILPLSLPNLYTYRVPFEKSGLLLTGQRVAVQFGKKKLYSALIRRIHQAPPRQYEAKYIHSLLDSKPIVTEFQFQFWEWMASYYMCTIGEVMNAALPSGLKLSSETKIVVNPEFALHREQEQKISYEALTDKEYLIVEALELREVITLDEAAEILEHSTVYAVIKSLIEKRVILTQEDLHERYKPKMQDFLRLTADYRAETKLKEVLDKLQKKAGKQLDVLMAYLSLSGLHETTESSEWVKKSDLIKMVGGSDTIMKALVKKNILELKRVENWRLLTKSATAAGNQLNKEQDLAFVQIENNFKEKDVVLLHGVTSSGKTEIYIRLIEKVLLQGKQVLYLLPEIALTAQIVNRLRSVFNNQVGVYHSRFNENERVEIWNNVLNGTYNVILGARSSLFLPFSNLGLIIVDEEHDTSYKQFDPSPRYNARDSAIFLAHIHGANILLGSATPSLETYFNAQAGKYGLVEMKQRYGDVLMPEIKVVDIKDATKRKMMKSHFTPQLLEEIELTLENKEQVILFQNRRGFSPVIECETCAWSPQCKNCDVSLTYHKTGNQLRCHYCGYHIAVPGKCGACGETNLKTKGFGTEKIEEELSVFFPAARIFRMDLDTTRAKNAYQQIISDFEDQKIDILVGTQMVTKGLDFDNVSLVGILNADSSLNFPDFRSFERSYQIMAQVSGRSGRKNKRGKVIIQSHNPGHPIIVDVINNDYLQMYNTELVDRKSFHYPPFYRLIELTLKCKDSDVLNEGANYVATQLRGQFGDRVLGPEFPLVGRVRNEFLKAVMIKIERDASISSVKRKINEDLTNFKLQPSFRKVRVHIDVDPL